MKNRWLLIGVAALALSVALGAIACGGGNGNKGGKATVAATQPARGTTPKATQPAGGTTPGATQPSGGATPKATQGSGGQPGAFTTVVATKNASMGTILTTFDGFTLYTFDSDTAGASSCTGSCQNTWPPLVITGAPSAGAGVSGTLGTIKRDDGSTQVTLDGKPLYMNSSDSGPGATNGDGIGGLWHVVSLN